MRCGIALGSNVGDRLSYLRRAVEVLGLPVTAKAGVYETAPVDCPVDAPAFYNSVIEVETDLAPAELLARTQRVECDLGRPASHGYHAPRTIDLDLLYLGDIRCRTDALELPHPRISVRRFVLEPLAAIRPRLILPGMEKSVAELLLTLDSSEPELHLIASEW